MLSASRSAVRVSSRCLKTYSIRPLHSSALSWAASKFAMPAMSPTMEKGGIIDWKFKPGDEFSAGDVLLEVETDKAQIDVEAQDDGILAKILVDNGVKDIPVGQTIAFLAEPEDDIKTLEYPSTENEGKKEEPKKEEKKEEKKKEEPKEEDKKDSAPPSTKGSGSVYSKANPDQTLFPSVLNLLAANNISKEEALEQIQATGPNGRLLKGDVLAFLGKIAKEANEAVAAYYNAGEHLDLSKVVGTPIKAQEETPAGEAKDGKAAALPKPEPKILRQAFDLTPILKLHAESLGKVKPFTVEEYVAEAARKSEAYALQRHPVKSDYYDDLFEDIVAVPSSVPRFQAKYKIKNTEHAPAAVRVSQPSIFDLLAGTSVGAASSGLEPAETPCVDVEVTVNEKVADAEEKTQLYLKKLGEYLSIE